MPESTTKAKSTWRAYFDAPVDQRAFQRSVRLFEDEFAPQRQVITELVDSLHPSQMVCLGSGFLNDIPIDTIFAAVEHVVFVDWIGELSEQGIKGRLITSEHDDYRCLFCEKRIGGEFCESFTGYVPGRGTCDGFIRVEEPVLTCGNYRPGAQPRFLTADVTAGIASRFGETIERKVAQSRTAKDALVKANKACQSIQGKHEQLALDSDSVDLVTSSMVISQFEAEPYGYFASLLEARFGRSELLGHEDRLRPLVERLRSNLFLLQVDAHAKEMHRLVKKDGTALAYLSFELFRSLGQGQNYFLIPDMAKALDIFGKYFRFNFDSVSTGGERHMAVMDDAVSVIQHYVLVPDVLVPDVLVPA